MATTLPLTVPDLVCVDDVDLFARETTSDLETLVQDVYHTLIELPGSNLDVPTRGIGITTLLSGTTANLTTIINKIDQQLPQDSRIDGCSTTITQDPNGTYRINIVLQVDGSVVGMQLDWAAAAGLVLASWGLQ